jgi:hypothetical protein
MYFPKLFYRLRPFFCLIFSLVMMSCSSSDPDEEDTSKLSDLNVEVEIVGSSASNPNGDGSGRINVSFSAKNANSYRVNFGNGDVLETSSNNLAYTYVGSGTNTYQLYVSAYKGSQFISEGKSITIYVEPSMAFSEEFNYSGAPDASKWTFDIGRGDNGWGNSEAQFYTSRPENVVVDNGILKITAKKENYEGAAYTSTRMKTQGKFSFKYGKVEVRAKLPQGGGTWPAIWMLGSNITSVGWPACGEIDIMEHVGNNPNTVISAIHTPSSYGNTQNKATTKVQNATTEFHVYGLEWTPEKLVFSVDGNVHYTYSPANKNSSTWPFDSNQFIILNIAVGGTLGGTIDPNFTSGTMEIDYVRVYK